jgi:DNA ligase-associated metallophosphoesterase
MDKFAFEFCAEGFIALPSGALFWPTESTLIVSDLHFGKSARQGQYGGALLPPYETRETLKRLDADMALTSPAHVVCLGDSFDAPRLEYFLPKHDLEWMIRLQAGVKWTWIEGNHDPGPIALGGEHLAELSINHLKLRHIATHDTGEISGHYHPKVRLKLRGRTISRPCFLWDQSRLILPAYGTYTGGLFCESQTLRRVMHTEAKAILTGQRPCAIPAFDLQP